MWNYLCDDSMYHVHGLVIQDLKTNLGHHRDLPGNPMFNFSNSIFVIFSDAYHWVQYKLCIARTIHICCEIQRAINGHIGRGWVLAKATACLQIGASTQYHVIRIEIRQFIYKDNKYMIFNKRKPKTYSHTHNTHTTNTIHTQHTQYTHTYSLT